MTFEITADAHPAWAASRKEHGPLFVVVETEGEANCWTNAPAGSYVLRVYGEMNQHGELMEIAFEGPELLAWARTLVAALEQTERQKNCKE